MKRERLIGVGVAAVLVLLAAVYLWGPGSAPRGQDPVVTLSEENLGEFENAFDGETDVPRLVLLLSPNESRTTECVSSGTRSMSCPRN